MTDPMLDGSAAVQGACGERLCAAEWAELTRMLVATHSSYQGCLVDTLGVRSQKYSTRLA
jgi:hypothetical protein